MKEKIIIETIGTIEKKELLASVGYDELVLESSKPFPGYHGTTVPDSVYPGSLFVVTRSKYTEEKVIRVIQKIKKNHKYKFDGSPGMVNLYNMLNPCIRLKDVEDYEQVPAILKSFKDEGLEFMSNRKVEPYTGIIKIKKYFLLDPVSDCTFKDVENKAMHYFSIPFQLRFNQFEKITIEIKRNMEDNNFDAALGSFYRRMGLVDVIRIYDESCDDERLNYIRKKYSQGIKKLMK
jgi:hypothetical protein